MTEFMENLRKLPDNLSQHVLLTLGALGVGVVLSMLLAAWALRSKTVRAVSLTGASVAQTIPSIAMLAFMVVAFDMIGFTPALLGLIIYSILPILRNTITGIEGVDPAVIDAARGIGMTPRQMLLRVELPLAAPVIIAGIRTATVWVVGIATLGTPVGADCLGNYIFSGLQLQRPQTMLFGIVSAVVLAIVLDQLIRLIESGLTTRSRRKVAGGLCGLCVVLALALGPSLVGGGRGDRVRIGAKTFAEQYILAELIADILHTAGIPADRLDSLGSTVAFEALANDDIGVYVDYTGTIWANHMKRDGTAPRGEVLAEVSAWVFAERGITLLGPLGFENAYALALRREDAERLGIRTVADLARHTGDMTIGGDYEFFDRPEWKALRDAYGLDFQREQSMDSTLMYEAVALGEVDVISAFSTDGRIAAYDLTVLADPRQALPPYDAVLLLSPESGADSRLRGALQDLVGAIDDEAMRRANMLVDVDERPVSEAADLLRAQIRPDSPIPD